MNVRQRPFRTLSPCTARDASAKAARLYEAIAAREPGNAEARHYLGAILASAGRLQEAKALNEARARAQAERVRLSRKLCRGAGAPEDFAEALELSAKALSGSRATQSRLSQRGVAAELDRLDEARAAFVALLRCPRPPAGRKEYASADASGRTRRGAAVIGR